MCQAFSGESAYLAITERRQYPKCERCGHQFYTHAPLGCPKCDRLPTAADHAALIAKVREIAENMPHAPDCESLIEVWVDTKVYIGFEFPYECTCPRGKLLEVINGRD